MEIARDAVAVPWRFDNGEKEQLQQIFSSPLAKCYLASLLSLALDAKLVNPDEPEMSVELANAYMAGQQYTLDALLTTPLYVPQIIEPTKE